ncbi:hypothetical protein GWK47_050369 [Chionoecetes opilio]|uniref:Uncharacterized protein n=1 Tax=Chionoecetes opilio TaxID=41210 RepID=A0A8J5CTR0_CHIOP|nr:hypothetical protein GWK47_050369 [Chionoecetes opilio]
MVHSLQRLLLSLTFSGLEDHLAVGAFPRNIPGAMRLLMLLPKMALSEVNITPLRCRSHAKRSDFSVCRSAWDRSPATPSVATSMGSINRTDSSRHNG